MPYIYLDHEADIGIRTTGSTLEEAFEEGAKAMLNVMWDTSTIEEPQHFSVESSAENIPELFVEILNEILFVQGVKELALAGLKIDEITKLESGRYKVKGTVSGEPLNLEKHTVKTEVKAATYAGLLYEKNKGQHIMQCILDV